MDGTLGELQYPFGRGINFSIEVDDIDTLYNKLLAVNHPLYRPMVTSTYEVNGQSTTQKEFLIQDPDGYLLRFTHE